MEREVANRQADKQCNDHASPEELVRLHESIFTYSPLPSANNGYVGFPPAFEFKKVSIWKDVPGTYSTNTSTGDDHA